MSPLLKSVCFATAFRGLLCHQLLPSRCAEQPKEYLGALMFKIEDGIRTAN